VAKLRPAKSGKAAETLGSAGCETASASLIPVLGIFGNGGYGESQVRNKIVTDPLTVAARAL
jgi:hypothetical protein